MTARALTKHRLHGFTIIEILISIVIIALAFAGILAMLAGSTKLAGEVVEDTFATTLARSVYEALREGARKNSFIVNETASGSTYPVTGFVFIHEGVVQQVGATSPPVTQYTPPGLPTSTTDIATLNLLRASDFAIFLPQGKNPAWTGGGTGEPIFVFPRPDGAAAENVTGSRYGTDDFLGGYQASKGSVAIGAQNQPVYLDVKRVYQIKDRDPSKLPTTTGTAAPPIEASDQYSFAVAIKRSIAPPLRDKDGVSFLDWKNVTAPRTAPFLPAGPPYATYTPANLYVNGLYQVEVRVYRQFSPATNNRHHEPVAGGGFVGLIALGQADTK